MKKQTRLEYLNARLDSITSALCDTQKEIKEEERRTERFEVQVVVKTKHGGLWRETTLVGLDLTSEQRQKMIMSLSWLRDIGW